MSNHKIKNFFLTLLLVFTTSVFIFAGNVKPAQAILGVGDISVTVGDIPRQIGDLILRIRSRYGSLAFQRAIRAVSYKLAQDTAVFIGNGGKGKKPLIFEDFGSWAKGAADEVAGKYIVNLTAGFPVDFCSPSSIKSQLAITIGISKSLSQIKIGEALLGYCPPGSAQSTPAKPGVGGRASLVVKNGAAGDVLNQITVGTVGTNNLFSSSVAWPGSADNMANAIITEINGTSSSRGPAQNFVASAGADTADGFPTIIITSPAPAGAAYNNAGFGLNLAWGVGDGITFGFDTTSSFSGGTDAVAASTGLSNCTANVNRDIGAQGCSFSKIRENFAEAVKAKNFLVDVQTGFEPGKNDLLIASTLAADAKKKLEDEKQAQTIERLKTGDIKGVADPIIKQVRTPSEQTKQAQSDAQAKASKEPPRTEDIFTDTLAVFTNTLAQTYLKRLQSGYYPFRSTKRAAGPDSELTGSAGSTEALISSFAIFSPDRALNLGTAGEVDLFSEMTTCPPAALQTPYNCLLNSGLQQAIQQGLSVAQAVSAKYIDPNLLFPEEPDVNQAKLSADNLAKLRFLRVLPVGWELAAEVLNKNGKKVEMQTLLNCFENQAAGDACNVDGQLGPPVINDLYHLVDPDWILALPKQFCRAQGYTGIPENEKSPNRQQICVDLQSCLKQDSSGNCQGYGYCTRERAVWQLQGQTCEPQFATCRSLRRPDGSQLSVLGSDVNANGCTQANAGCNWYSRPADGSTNWTGDQRVYLTNQAPICSLADAGSREIIPLEPGINLFYNDSQGPIKIKPYTYYTVSFVPDSAAESGVSVAASGASNVSFPADDLILNIPAATGRMSRYAATFFSGPARSLTIAPTGPITDLQLEEVGLAAGKRALDIIQSTKASNPAAGIETFNAFSGGTFNQASPATFYHPYATNRRLVFAAADSCQPEEASARAYAPLRGDGPVRVARLTAAGLCPRECSGLDTFLAMPTPLEKLATASALSPSPVSFIPSYGRACSAAEVGCEEFTNLSPAAPERKEYYRRIEACVLDSNPNAATFYTWQGTDTAGFQLKAWQMLRETNPSNGQPFGGPCGTFALGSQANPATASCSGSLPRRACEPGAADPNCRVFLDTDGIEYTRDIRQLVTASGECRGFRRTNDNQTWFFIPSEANSCSPQAALCRQYKGRQANVTTRILFDDFAADADGWDVSNGAGQFYPDAVVKNGHSYLIPAAGAALKTNDKLIADQGNVAADYSFTGKTFIVKFLSRSLNATAESPGRITRVFLGSGATEHDFPAGADEGGSPQRAVRLINDWREYTVGPLVYSGADQPDLTIEAAGSDILIDNIELTQVQDNLYLITDSWQDRQPALCTAGAADERFGRCAPYRDTDNNTYYVSQFAALFDNEAQFCRAVIDTRNSDAPGEERFNQNNDAGQDPDRIKDNVIVPADDLDYFILQPENLRPPGAAGCTAVGKPNDAAAPTAWETNYRRIDPDTFLSGALCRAEGLGCQSFQAADGSVNFTLRDPGTHLCGYNSAAKTFTELDASGNLTAVECSVNPNSPTGWVRQCPVAQSGCTAYAPSDPQQGEGGAATIFALANTVETGNCTGSSLKDGCLAFTQAYSDVIKGIGVDNLMASSTRALAVKSTRQCAEWLAPVTTSLGTDPKGNASRTVVYDLGRCQELGPDGRCLSWADSTNLDNTLRPYPGAYVTNPTGHIAGIVKFNTIQYQNRFTSSRPNLFAGAWDYSGYSIPNQFPLEVLNENTAGNILQYQGTPAAGALACRSYPEEDAPFASTRIDFRQDEKGNLKPNYGPGTRQLESLNKCAPGEDGRGTGSCECSYKKVTSTDGEAAYFGQRSTQALPAETESITTQDGWYGYCAAYDYSTLDPNGNPVCLTWWPVDAVKAKPNVFDNHPEAGFTAAAPQYYCLAARGNKLNNDEFGIKPVKAASGEDLVKNNNYFIEVPYVWNQEDDKDFRVNIAPFAINVGGTKHNADFLTWGGVWTVIKADLAFLVPYYGWFNFLDEVKDTIETAMESDGIVVFPFSFIGYQNKDVNRIVLHTHGCAIHPTSGGCISNRPFKDDGTDNPHYLEDGKPEYRAGEYELDQNGWSKESGLLTFPVNNAPAIAALRSPIADLREYDIEKIILKPLDHQYSDWPKSNTEIILQRSGWARQAAGASTIEADTDDRWTAYWCTGESCDFGSKFSWDTIVEYLKNTKVDGIGSDEDRQGLCTTLQGGTNLLAVRAVFADAEGNIPEGYEDFKQGIAGMKTDLHKHNYVKNFGFSGSHQEPYSFLGLQGGLCDRSGSEGWVPLRMIIQLREWCTTVAAVTDTATGENRAWTGRVNNQSTTSFTTYDSNNPEKLVGLYNTDFTFNQDSKPFGAIVPPTSTIYTPEKWDSRLDFTEEEAIVNGRLATIQKPLEPGKQPLYVEAPQKQTRAGSPFACTVAGNRCVIPPVKNGPQTEKYVVSNASLSDLIAHPFDYLKQIFAKVYKIWSWDAGKDSYWPLALTGEEGRLDLTQTTGDCPIMQAVQVVNGAYAPVTGDQNGPADCAAGRYSINGKTASNLDNLPIAVDAGVEVSLDFYAYNENGEQLPLRQIIIDWDGPASEEPVTEIRGNFKNHHPNCDNFNFGRSGQACDPNILQFKHVYQLPGAKTPIITVIDNWGKATRSSYSYPVINVNEPRLNLPPVSFQPAPSGNPESGTEITFNWVWTPPDGVSILNYRLILTKNFADAGSILITPPRQGGLSFSVPSDPSLKSVSLSVRPCIEQGCGIDARETVYYRPSAVGAIDTSPDVPRFGAPLSISWPASLLADSYEVEFDQKGGVPPIAYSSSVTTNTEFTYQYEPGATHVRVRVRPKSGAVFGDYSFTSPELLEYQDGVVIDSSSTGHITQSYRALSHVIQTNKPANEVSFYLAPLPDWLQIDANGAFVANPNRSPTAADVGDYEFNVEVIHGPSVTVDIKPIQLTVVETCGNATIDAGEDCEPGAAVAETCAAGITCTPQDMGQRGKCTASCLWAGNTDGDGFSAQDDCWNNDADAHPGSTYQGTTQKDYNCDREISQSGPQCLDPRQAQVTTTQGNCENLSHAQGLCDSYLPGSTASGAGGSANCYADADGSRYFNYCNWCAASGILYW